MAEKIIHFLGFTIKIKKSYIPFYENTQNHQTYLTIPVQCTFIIVIFEKDFDALGHFL